jgi:cytochrome c
MARRRGRSRAAAKRHVKSVQIFFAILVAGWLTNWTSVAAQDEPSMKEVMSGDCFSCHKIDQDDVGPAWVSVADHYHHDSSKAPYLADRIRKGSVGDWGKVAMPAHDYLSQKLALQLASYVLSLKGSLKKEVSRKYKYTNTAGKAVTVDFPVFETNKNRQVVSDAIFGGFEKYNSYCFRCHGFDAVGGEYAPDLRQSLSNGMTKRSFFTVSMAGKPDKGMPAWAGFFTSDDLNQIYQYVKARSLDLIGPGRPPSSTD